MGSTRAFLAAHGAGQMAGGIILQSAKHKPLVVDTLLQGDCVKCCGHELPWEACVGPKQVLEVT